MMKRQPVQMRAVQQVSTVETVQSPVGGWNARDSLANMQPRDAITLENFFPTTIDVVSRKGFASHGTITGTCETLAVQNEADGTQTMFAASDTDVYDVTSAGAGSAQSLTVTDGKFQWLNMGDGTNEWLLMFNGVDAPKYFNGTSWVEVTGVSSPALTGVTAANVIAGHQYNERLYLIEKDKLGFWYLTAGAVGGAATYFDLSTYADKGGYVMWAASWTMDGGDGMDDYIVFMTSEGQAIVYQGSDPSTSTLWTRRGTYDLPRPLGRRSWIKFGGDIVCITGGGVFGLTDFVQDKEKDKRVAMTDKIEPIFAQSAVSYGTNFGWEAALHWTENAMLFNVPIDSSTSEQYVMNTISKSWCKFSAWNATTFAVFNDELYFGDGAAVYKAWSGASDNGSDIMAFGRQAFNNFGAVSQLKDFKMFRPFMQVNGNAGFLADFDVDFRDDPISGSAIVTTSSGATWDTSTWDSAEWTSTLEIIRDWTSPSANTGNYVSGKIKVNTSDVQYHWIASDYLYETGGVLG